jgi:hypothetical protein
MMPLATVALDTTRIIKVITQLSLVAVMVIMANNNNRPIMHKMIHEPGKASNINSSNINSGMANMQTNSTSNNNMTPTLSTRSSSTMTIMGSSNKDRLWVKLSKLATIMAAVAVVIPTTVLLITVVAATRVLWGTPMLARIILKAVAMDSVARVR